MLPAPITPSNSNTLKQVGQHLGFSGNVIQCRIVNIRGPTEYIEKKTRTTRFILDLLVKDENVVQVKIWIKYSSALEHYRSLNVGDLVEIHGATSKPLEPGKRWNSEQLGTVGFTLSMPENGTTSFQVIKIKGEMFTEPIVQVRRDETDVNVLVEKSLMELCTLMNTPEKKPFNKAIKVKIMVCVLEVLEFQEFPKPKCGVFMQDGSAITKLILWGDQVKFAAEWRPGETVLLITVRCFFRCFKCAIDVTEKLTRNTGATSVKLWKRNTTEHWSK
jgi:hypothetical protein